MNSFLLTSLSQSWIRSFVLDADMDPPRFRLPSDTASSSGSLRHAKTDGTRLQPMNRKPCAIWCGATINSGWTR